jgi:hypothetical protein
LTSDGLNVKETAHVGTNVRVAVLETPFKEAVIVTVVEAVTG